MMDKIKEKIKDAWYSLSRKSEEEQMSGIGREKIIVFIVALVLAFALWLVVNFNREYNIDVSLPVSVGNISTNQALAEELPDKVTASINGDGWSLMNVYQSPPQVYIDVTEQEVNLFEQVRQQMSAVSNITVQTVEPLYLQLKLEEKQSKKVPVIPNIDVTFARQYNFLGEPELVPDSVTIRGAASKIQNMDRWPTKPVQLQNIKNPVSQQIALKEPTSLITLSRSSVQYRADVTQYTEAEATVSVERRDFPAGFNATFSPSSITVRYLIPLEEYAAFSNRQPFAAYVNYSQIQQDTTGFVRVHTEELIDEAHLKVRRIQPAKVAYFTIVGS